MAGQRVVGDEEQGGAGRGTYDCRSNAPIDAGEAAGGEETGRGLETRFQGVERVEGQVYGCACQAACLCLKLLVAAVGREWCV
jgi:hypothetical protein